MDLTGLTFRVPLVQGRRNNLVDKYTGQKIDGIARGNAVTFQHAIFLGDPKAVNLAGLAEVTSVTMVMRKTGPTGDFLLDKTVGIEDFADAGMTFADWDADTGYQFAIALTAEETNQTPPGGSTELAIYFAWEATLASGDPVFLGSATTRIFEEGIGTAGTPTPGDPTYLTGPETSAAIAAGVAGEAGARAAAVSAEAAARAAADTTLTAAAAAAHAAGIAGEAINFTGGSASFATTLPAGLAKGAFCCWFRPRSFVNYGNIFDGNQAFSLATYGDGRLVFAIGGVADIFHFTPVLSTHDTILIGLDFDNAAGTVELYLNGALADSRTFTTYGGALLPITKIGLGGDQPIDGELALGQIYNYCLGADKHLAHYERGGELAPINRGGSMTSIITGAASDFSSDAGFWTKESSATISGGAANFVGTDSRLRRNNILTPGRRYRLTFTLTSYTSGSPYVIDGSGTPLGTISAATGTQTIEFTTANYTNAEHLLIGNFVGSIDDLTLIPLGALVAIDRADRHAGFQVADVSGNGHHLNLPAAGVSIGNPARRGQLRFTHAAATATQHGYIPINAVIERIVVTGGSYEQAITIGLSSGAPDTVFIGQAYGQTDARPADVPCIASVAPDSAAAQPVWAASDEVDAMDITIDYFLAD